MLSRPTLARRLCQPYLLRNHLSRSSLAPPKFNACSPVSYRQYAFQPRRPQYNRFQQVGALWKSSPGFRIGLVAVGGGIVVWIGSNIERVPGSGRWRFNCVSEEYETKLGIMSYQQTMQAYRGGILNPRDPRHKIVGKVLTRLLPNSGLKGDWEYHVIDDPDQINAFVIPGGKVFVFSGILPICKNEDGLATVLGHEIAHNMAHHLQESASLPYLFTLIFGLVTFFVDNSAQLTQLVLNYGLDLPNSRAQEIQVRSMSNVDLSQMGTYGESGEGCCTATAFNPSECISV
ncbi:MAG: hypothetical protein Q9225_001802 [Loekoesia sp. 1 TL-2023]